MLPIKCHTTGKGPGDKRPYSCARDHCRNKDLKIIPNFIWIIGLCLSVITGCAVMQGKMTKSYDHEYHDTVRASSDTLKNLKIPVTEKQSDELKTVMNARRFDGTPVTIEVVRINPNLTEVSVRAGEGIKLDNRVSGQIHEFIGANLVQQAKPGITEEDLADESAKELSSPEYSAGSDDQTQGKDPLKHAEVYMDSIFVIYFDLDSNDLTAKAQGKLDRVADLVMKNPNVEITLNGYTDSYGDPSYNQIVSERRAGMVKTYLVGKGVDPAKIEAVGYGPQKFLASNRTREGRRLNRRVEIEVSNLTR